MAEYNPNGSYTWSNDTIFTLTGDEFGLITTTLKALLNTEEAMKYHLLFECNKIIQKTIIEAVEQDLITEQIENENNN